MFASWAAPCKVPAGWDWDPACDFTRPPPVGVQQPSGGGLLHKQPTVATADSAGGVGGQVTGLGGLMLTPDVANLTLEGAAAPPSSLYINNNPTDISGVSTSCNNSPHVVISAAEDVGAGRAQKKRRRPDGGCASGLLNSIWSSSTSAQVAAIGHQHQPFACQVDGHDQQGGLAPFLRRHLLDVDALVTAHMDKLRSEVLESHRRLLASLAAAADAALARRVRQKQEHIGLISQANAELEERVRWLAAEAMAWRDVARANEESAAALQRDLDAALLCRQHLQQRRLFLQEQEEGHVEAAGPASDQDAKESCCGNSDDGKDQEVGLPAEGTVSVTARRWCRDCGVDQAVAVLLPCRHMCLCSGCAQRAQACPVCSCAKQSAVHINLSLPCSSSPPPI